MKLHQFIKILQTIQENTKHDFDDVEVYLRNNDIPLTKDGLIIGNSLSLQWIFDDINNNYQSQGENKNEK
jgi:hypothetical protein